MDLNLIIPTDKPADILKDAYAFLPVQFTYDEENKALLAVINTGHGLTDAQKSILKSHPYTITFVLDDVVAPAAAA